MEGFVFLFSEYNYEITGKTPFVKKTLNITDCKKNQAAKTIWYR